MSKIHMFCVSDNTFGIYFLRSFSLLILKGKICFAFLITEKNGNRTPQKMSMNKAPAQRVNRNKRKEKLGDLCPEGVLPACPVCFWLSSAGARALISTDCPVVEFGYLVFFVPACIFTK